MKILNTAPISNISQFPVKKGTLQFLQDANKEAFAAVMISLIGPTYNLATVYILSGVLNSLTAPAYNISTGYGFYNGELFIIDATSFTALGSNVALFQINTTQYTVDADPVTFTNTVIMNVHDIRKIQIVQGASGTGIGDFTAAFRMNLVIPKQVNITAPVTDAYVGNQVQIIGAYPDLILFVSPASNLCPVLDSGSFNVGDIGGTGFDHSVVFTTPLATGNYFINGTIVSQGSPEPDTSIIWTIRNRTNTGFTIHFREVGPYVSNIAFEWMVFAKP